MAIQIRGWKNGYLYTSKSDVFTCEKNGNKYLLKHHLNYNKGWGTPSLVDSIKLINALTEFEATIIGLQEMEIMEHFITSKVFKFT